MKRFLICLTLFPLLSLGQNAGLVIDTTYYSNDSINTIEQFYIDHEGKRISEGLYLNYDSTGGVRMEGRYRHASIIQCVNCYEEIISEDDSNWVKYSVAKHSLGSTKIGVWKRYYENGNLESIGEYTGDVRESYGIFWEAEKKSIGSSASMIGNGIYQIEKIKVGEWFYYSLLGQKLKREVYRDGFVVFKETWVYDE